MTGVVADTHAIAWFLFEPHMLSAAAKQAFIDAGDPCFVIGAGANVGAHLVQP